MNMSVERHEKVSSFLCDLKGLLEVHNAVLNLEFNRDDVTLGFDLIDEVYGCNIMTIESHTELIEPWNLGARIDEQESIIADLHRLDEQDSIIADAS